MNANDHEDHGDDEMQLRRAQLEKVETAIKHTREGLVDLVEVRDALRAELGTPTTYSTYWDSVETGSKEDAAALGAYLQRLGYALEDNEKRHVRFWRRR